MEGMGVQLGTTIQARLRIHFIRELQIKTILLYTHQDDHNKKRETITSIRKIGSSWNPHIAGGNVKWCSHFEIILQFLNIESPFNPALSL